MKQPQGASALFAALTQANSEPCRAIAKSDYLVALYADSDGFNECGVMNIAMGKCALDALLCSIFIAANVELED